MLITAGIHASCQEEAPIRGTCVCESVSSLLSSLNALYSSSNVMCLTEELLEIAILREMLTFEMLHHSEISACNFLSSEISAQAYQPVSMWLELIALLADSSCSEFPIFVSAVWIHCISRKLKQERVSFILLSKESVHEFAEAGKTVVLIRVCSAQRLHPAIRTMIL